MSETTPEFGIKRENEEKRDGGCAVVYNPINKKFAIGKEINGGLFRLFSGGIDKGEDVKEGIMRAEAITHYRNNLKNVNRVAHATCFLAILKSDQLKPTKLEEHEKFTLHWACADELLQNWNERNQNKDMDHWIYFFEKCLKRVEELGV